MAKSQAWRLEAGNEWVARDPFGKVKPADVSRRQADVTSGGQVVARKGSFGLRAARNGYASFRLWVSGAGCYRLAAEVEAPGVEVDLFKAWYHRMAPVKGGEKGPARLAGATPWQARYVVDCLVPAAANSPQALPDPDNAVPGQSCQEYWVDVFVGRDAPVGPAGGRIRLDAGGGELALPFRLEVLPAVVPDDDVVVCDHNSYGCRWVHALYPGSFTGLKSWPAKWNKTIQVLQHYFRICHEHRGLFSNLGAGHAGTFDPIYGPKSVGVGLSKSLTDWALFDRHYGPVLDGSAFRTAEPGAPPPRRPARAVWGVYTPINVAWPADWLWWGQRGYEAEFVRCVGQFDRHFRDKGWTSSRPEFFFNHKKRYRWFEWDGDEPKHSKDDAYYLEMGRLFKQAVGRTPVPWRFRMDASWQMKNNFARYAGLVDFYVCGGFIKWYPEEVAAVLDRGDVVWSYSGTPGIEAPSSALLEHVFRTWARGLGGHCEWLTVAPGADPWFNCEGAATGMIYPGQRFGLDGPLPSIRLKLQRNAVQDVTLISAGAGKNASEARRNIAARVPLALWEKPPPIVVNEPPEVWDSVNLAQKTEVNMAQFEPLDALWWSDIRQAALGAEVK